MKTTISLLLSCAVCLTLAANLQAADGPSSLTDEQYDICRKIAKAFLYNKKAKIPSLYAQLNGKVSPELIKEGVHHWTEALKLDLQHTQQSDAGNMFNSMLHQSQIAAATAPEAQQPATTTTTTSTTAATQHQATEPAAQGQIPGQEQPNQRHLTFYATQFQHIVNAFTDNNVTDLQAFFKTKLEYLMLNSVHHVSRATVLQGIANACRDLQTLQNTPAYRTFEKVLNATHDLQQQLGNHEMPRTQNASATQPPALLPKELAEQHAYKIEETTAVALSFIPRIQSRHLIQTLEELTRRIRQSAETSKSMAINSVGQTRQDNLNILERLSKIPVILLFAYSKQINAELAATVQQLAQQQQRKTMSKSEVTKLINENCSATVQSIAHFGIPKQFETATYQQIASENLLNCIDDAYAQLTKPTTTQIATGPIQEEKKEGNSLDLLRNLATSVSNSRGAGKKELSPASFLEILGLTLDDWQEAITTINTAHTNILKQGSPNEKQQAQSYYDIIAGFVSRNYYMLQQAHRPLVAPQQQQQQQQQPAIVRNTTPATTTTTTTTTAAAAPQQQQTRQTQQRRWQRQPQTGAAANPADIFAQIRQRANNQ